jgi:hypothetical protein
VAPGTPSYRASVLNKQRDGVISTFVAWGKDCKVKVETTFTTGINGDFSLVHAPSDRAETEHLDTICHRTAIPGRIFTDVCNLFNDPCVAPAFKNLHSAHTVYLYDPYGSNNKQRLFP